MILASWIGYKIWKRDWTLFIRAKDIDLDTGRINVDLDLLQQEIAEEKAQLAENHSILEFIDFGAKNNR